MGHLWENWGTCGKCGTILGFNPWDVGGKACFFWQNLGKTWWENNIVCLCFFGGNPFVSNQSLCRKNNRVKLDDLSHSDEFSAWVQWPFIIHRGKKLRWTSETWKHYLLLPVWNSFNKLDRPSVAMIILEFQSGATSLSRHRLLQPSIPEFLEPVVTRLDTGWTTNP